ncbi:MAG: flagellin lysine-N-methylase [Clostridia bacterium]|nr:flagellin lysine-N-methylase [Clostridia bacterium]
MIVPDYYERFECIAGECRHNCCRGGWDIEIDDEALERFSHIEGEFGERVRAAIDEDNVFRHINGECPLLTGDGRCGMVMQGEKLCVICDEYPRFTEFYEDYRERGISLSCEAAADIIINNTRKLRLVGDGSGCTEPIFVFVNKARNAVFEILADREKDIFTRLRLALDYADAAQTRIHDNDYGEFSYEPKDSEPEHKSLSAYISLLRGLEVLDPAWSGMLDELYKHEDVAPRHSTDELQCEQLAVYFVYRYFLKGAFDCDVLTKMKFAALSVMTIAALENTFGDIYECARLYSIEIEHDEDNVEAIYDELIFGDGLSYDDILGMIN